MNSPKPKVFDASLFVSVPHGFVLPPRPSAWPKKLCGARECIESAIYMASQIELVDHEASSFRPDRVRSAYFRASLSELCRIEDIIQSTDGNYSFYNSADPSLHLIKLLRNYQIHVSAIPLSAGQVTVQLSGETAVYQGYIASNVNAEDLQSLRSSKGYTLAQLTELVQLFDLHQRVFGVTQFFYHLAKRVEAIAQRALTPRSTRTPPALPVLLFLALAYSASFGASVQAVPVSFIR